jgi:predicted nuclease of predicted toxin-antitoxin system
MQRAEDEDILTLAIERGAIVITLDSDFHALVAVRAMTAPSVVRLRREGCRAEAVVRILRNVRAHYHSQIAKGCLLSVTKHPFAVHRLPVVREG